MEWLILYYIFDFLTIQRYYFATIRLQRYNYYLLNFSTILSRLFICILQLC